MPKNSTLKTSEGDYHNYVHDQVYSKFDLKIEINNFKNTFANIQGVKYVDLL